MTAKAPRSAKEYRHRQVAERDTQMQEFLEKISGWEKQYGLALPISLRPAIQTLRRTYKNTRSLPCRVKLAGKTEWIDPCLIVFAPQDADYLQSYTSIVVGGQIEEIQPSTLALPPTIIKATNETLEYRMSTYQPLLVSIGGEEKYLVPAHSQFLRYGEWVGRDVDPQWHADPDLDQHRMGKYVWTDNLYQETTVILCENISGGLNFLQRFFPNF